MSKLGFEFALESYMVRSKIFDGHWDLFPSLTDTRNLENTCKIMIFGNKSHHFEEFEKTLTSEIFTEVEVISKDFKTEEFSKK